MGLEKKIITHTSDLENLENAMREISICPYNVKQWSHGKNLLHDTFSIWFAIFY